MSQTSIRVDDTGYTPPGFLENLVKPLTMFTSEKTLSSPSLPSEPSLQKLASFSYPTNHTPKASSPTLKLQRTNSLVDEDKTILRKFKIFYQTEMHGRRKEEQITELWQRFEKSLENPWIFDRFIEDIRRDCTQQANTVVETLDLKQITASPLKVKPHSIPKQYSRRFSAYSPPKSHEKIELSVPQSKKKRMRKEIKHIHVIIKHGQKFLKDK